MNENTNDDAPMSDADARGLARLAYHARLIELVKATERYAALIREVAEAAGRADPEGRAPDQPEEAAAVRAVTALLRSAVENAPGMAEVFAAACGHLRPAIPV